MAELLTAGLVPRDVRTIWLTPLFSSASVSDAIRKLTTPGLVVIGTQDHEYDADKLSSLQAAGGHRVSVLEGAHHGLAVEGDACKSAAIPARLVAEVSSYLAAGAPIARAD
jgi:pimeloyl-ACP methyl ester carboxylesterase